MSLRLRILLSMLTVAAVALVLGGVVARQAVRSEFTTVVDTELLDEEVDRIDNHRAITGSWDGVEELLRELDQESGLRLIVTDQDELVIADSRSSDELPPLEILPSYSFFYGAGESREDNFLFTVDIIGPTNSADDALATVDRRFVLAGLASLGIAGLFGIWLAGIMTEPVRDLAAAVADMRAGKPNRGASEGPGELGALARSFNEMATDLERSESNRQAMVADAAHELRTPLANLKGHLEAIDDGVIKPDSETIAGLVGDVGRLGRLVDDLQSLALAEADAIVLNLSTIDPATVLGRVASEHAARATAANVVVSVSAIAQLPNIAVDEVRIQQVLGNLVSNAMRYADRIELRAEMVGDSVVLIVADDGPGIPADQLARVFDRFHRVDPSRGRATGGGGLGLAIVQQLVRLHGGSVSVTSVEGEGATFSVRLPAIEP